jgi:hypothetical protein
MNRRKPHVPLYAETSSWKYTSRKDAREAALKGADRCEVCGSLPFVIDVSTPWDGYAYVPGGACGDESNHWYALSMYACLNMEVPGVA